MYHEFDYSCHNKSNFTKISHSESEKLKKIWGGNGIPGGDGDRLPTSDPLDVSIWAPTARLDSKPPPPRVSDYAAANHGPTCTRRHGHYPHSSAVSTFLHSNLLWLIVTLTLTVTTWRRPCANLLYSPVSTRTGSNEEECILTNLTK